ncbi:MAG: hypothetical protein ACT4OE_09630 [Sphingosinicella sp.]
MNFNYFELAILVGIPAILLLSLVATKLLTGQLSGLALVVASVFLAWLGVAVLILILFKGSGPRVMQASVEATFVLSLVVLAIRVVSYYVRKKRSNG